MGYVVYIKKSTKLATGKVFKTAAAAKAYITRGQRQQLIDPELVAIADVTDFYTDIEKKVTRKNLLTGESFEEGVNTPLYLSPSSDSYWSS